MEPKTNITITKNGEIIRQSTSHNINEPKNITAVWSIISIAYDEQDDLLTPSDIEHGNITIRYELPDSFDETYKVRVSANGIVAKKI